MATLTNLIDRRMQTRGFSLRAATADDSTRSVEAVLSTSNRVKVYNAWSGTTIEEILFAGGAEHKDQIPLLDSHERGSVENVLGSVRDIHVQGGNLAARLFFADDGGDAERAWQKVKDGHLTDVSVGYQVLDYIDVPARTSKTVGGQLYVAGSETLRISRRWKLKEASLVAIGADPASTIRSHGNVEVRNMPAIHVKNNTPTRESLLGGMLLRAGVEPADPVTAEKGDKYKNFSLPDLCREVCHLEGIETAGEHGEHLPTVVRSALEGETLGAILDSTFQGAIVETFRATEDSTRGWVNETTVANFLPTARARLETTENLEPIARGAVAEEAAPEATMESFRIMRFGKQLMLDEQDVLADRFGLLIETARDMGEAAARLRLDLVYSILLGNPTLSDDVALFDSTHLNLGEAGTALAAGSLATAMAAMANGAGGTENNGRRPDYLIVPEQLRVTALQIVHDMETAGATPLQIRADQRLSNGVIDPLIGETYAGSATAWYLACRRGLGGVEMASRTDGPVVRGGPLQAGQWGRWLDVCYDIGALAVGYRGLYKATGAGE